MSLTRFDPCVSLNNNLRFSQCINIDTRVIDIAISKQCCQSISGEFLESELLCKNTINSDYGICCMQATSHNRGFIGIWSNFTMVEGFLAHTDHQLNCADSKRLEAPMEIKIQHIPQDPRSLNFAPPTSAFDSVD